LESSLPPGEEPREKNQRAATKDEIKVLSSERRPTNKRITEKYMYRKRIERERQRERERERATTGRNKDRGEAGKGGRGGREP